MAIVIALTGPLRAQRADSVVTINEIHYHPTAGENLEWVELHNQMAVRVDLSGWRFSAGIDFSFPEGSVIEPGAYWVIASDPNIPELSEVANVLGPFLGMLDNGGESLRLRNRHGRIMDELSYRDAGKWPTAPDGGGVTLAKADPESASGSGRSWTWSEQSGGTPGAANFVAPGGEDSERVVGEATEWRWFTGSVPDTSWRVVGFDDSVWMAGRGHFSTSLVQNPSFEAESFTNSPGYVSGNGAISSWRTMEGDAPGGESRIGINTPGALDPFANNGTVPSGGNVAFIRGGVRSLSQTITGLQPGGRYLLSYRENGRSPTNPVGSASLGGLELAPPHTVTAVDSLDVFGQAYHHQVGAVFTATAASHELQLSNHAGIGDTILYDAVRLDAVSLYHSGGGAAPLHRSFSATQDTVILTAEVDPGSGGDGVRVGFKRTAGGGDLTSDGVLWVGIKDNGEVVLRADEDGGSHAVALSSGAATNAGSLHQVSLIWTRSNGRASVVIDEETVLNEVDLHATAGGSDGFFDPAVGGVSALFNSAGGNLSVLAVAEGSTPDTVLPIPVAAATYRLRTEFESTGAAEKELLLGLSSLGSVTVFLNGVELHRETGSSSGEFIVSGSALQPGRNALAVELSTQPGTLALALEVVLTTIEKGGGVLRGPLRLSEIGAAGTPGFFVEIRNAGAVGHSMNGYALNEFSLPNETLAPGEARSFAMNELGFNPPDEAVLFLFDPSGGVADAERVENRVRAYDFVGGSWQHPLSATPGADNSFALDTRIVINEIHYHNRPSYADPQNGVVFEENPLEWIELYNRSNDEVDLSAWSLRDGITYDFPPDTMLAPGAYLVVTNDEFGGQLNNRSERIHLRDANDNTVDEVEYLDGSPWPKRADGRGASLELRHPAADNAEASSWAASDEADKASWQSYRYRGRGVEPPGNNNPAHFHEFLMGMLAAGEILVDDLSVVEDPDGARRELIQNGDFESDLPGGSPAAWRILGNHQASGVVALPEGGRALKLVATGPLEHSYNLASTTFANGRSLNSSRTYEISFRAKWVAGSPQLNTRLYFNRLSRTHILPQPVVTGTPGAPNSVLELSPSPVVEDLRHAPMVPADGELVRVSARLSAPDGIASAVVHFNDGDGWSTAPMDEVGECYLAVLPGRAASAVVQFYVEATSTSGMVSISPAGGRDSRALYRVGDRSVGQREVPSLRLIMLPEEASFMHIAHHTPSNHRVGTTVIYNDREVWYDAGVRLRGSPYGRRGSRVGWNVQFPADRPFRGVHGTVAIDGGFSVPRGDGSGWVLVGPGVATNELIYNQMAHRAGGVPASHDDVIYIEAPRAGDDKLAQLKMARFGEIWKASSFPRGDEGTSFKFELIYHPTSTIDGNPESLKSVYNAVRGVDIEDMGPDKEAYRRNFWIQNHRDRDDYSGVIAAGAALSESTNNLRAATDAALDIDNWLRVSAFQALTMTLDSYNNGLAHNMLLYQRPGDGKVMWIPWDVDHAYYASPTSSIFGQANGDFANVIQIPANRRAYCGHLLDLCSTGFHPVYIADWVAHFNTVGEMPIAAHYTQWIRERRNHVLAQLNAQHPPQVFRITTNGGGNFNASAPEVVLRGKGWIDVREIILNASGEPLKVHWIDNNDWEIVVPIRAGANAIALTALDHGGKQVGTDSITVTNTGLVEPATAQNLVVSEIMYHPADPSGAEVAAGFTNDGFFEFIELENIGPAGIDLSGVDLTAGVAFDFGAAAVTELAPGERVLVVRDASAFAMRYGGGLSIAGEFASDTALANGGERVRLEDTGGGTIRDFSYGDKHPWPEDADGGGYSLVLVGPASNPDHALARNWRHSTLRDGNAGSGDAVEFTGDPAGDDDHDGLSNYLNFALGANGRGVGLQLAVENGMLNLSHTRNLAADELSITIEVSPDLTQWSQLVSAADSETVIAEGLSRVSWTLPVDAARKFARLRVNAR